MNNEIYDQLLGSVHKCKEYSESDYKEHYDNLKDADEFCAAASLYADERTELLANSLHRYQQLIDVSAEKMKLETEFLTKGKICFNFYTDIANLFGLGTQAYTTESKTPYIGVSELSLQDIYLLQLILLHEMQHAMDFVFFDGFNMGIAERELRSRITICNSLNEVQKQFNKLYKNAYIDQAYWYIILYNSPHVDQKIKEQYYELLEKNAKKMLSEQGINFSPLILRVFGRELVREGVDLRSNLLYRLNSDKGIIKLEREEIKNPIIEEVSEMDAHITGDTETADDEPISVKLSKITGEKLSGIDGSLSLVKNKMMEWHTYQEEFKNIKKQASIVITRNAESFNNIAVAEDSSIAVPKNFIKVQATPYMVGDTSLKDLKNLEIPNVSMNTGVNDDEVIMPKRMYNNALKKQRQEEDDYEDEIAKNMMSNLSDMFKKRE
ncbi:MAG: hypothetical protein U0354_09220 [Candidatus Sericytochromatia bacterium]